jgi:type II secretory pathway pseudopilin PulG
MAWHARRRLRPLRGDDSGFTLLEAVVSLLVATVAFTALAAGAMSAIRGTLSGRQNQQAADFMGREIEKLRLTDFGGLAVLATDLNPSTDDNLTSCSGGFTCVDPGNGTQERIVTDTGDSPAVQDHDFEVSGATSNRTTYRVRIYVTAPNWAERDYYRRLTVMVSWKDGATTRHRSDSTMVAYTQRGLPLPVFKLSPAGPTSMSVNPGAVVVYGMTVNNQGAPDRFDVAKSDSWAWSWYFDNGDGIFDNDVDAVPAQAVTDTDGNGVIDTGRLDPNGSVKIWIVFDTTGISLPTDPHTYNTTITATSVAQPLADGGVKTLPFATTVGTGVVTATPTPTGTGTSTPTPSPSPTTDCTAASSATGSAAASYTLRSYTLHNDSTPSDTSAQQTLSMAVTAPYATTLRQYSTDVMANQPGRVILPGGTAFPGSGATDPSKVADWRFPVGRKAYSGNAAINVWVAPTVGGSLAAANLTAYVYKYTKVGSSYAATPLTTIPLTISPFTCDGFQKVGGQAAISVPKNGSGSLGTNDWIGVRIVNSGTASARIAYDVLSVYPAAVVLPES